MVYMFDYKELDVKFNIEVSCLNNV